jgi:hypothetical protein
MDKYELPYLYWIPKLHKNPYKVLRNIAGSNKCSTKPLTLPLAAELLRYGYYILFSDHNGQRLKYKTITLQFCSYPAPHQNITSCEGITSNVLCHYTFARSGVNQM